MKHTIGSVLQFTPTTPGGDVSIHHPNDKNPTIYPLLGWAIVVTWNGANNEPDDIDPGEQETKLHPVVLAHGYPTTLHDFVLDEPGLTYEVRS